MKITSIEPQKKADRFNLFVDGKFRAGLSSRSIAEFHLYQDKEITESVLRDVVEDDIFVRLYDRCIAKLARRPHSVSEIERYIDQVIYKKKKVWFDGLEESDLEDLALRLRSKLVAKLQKTSLLADEAFVKWWIQNRCEFRPRGWIAIRQELLSKGVDGKLIDENRFSRSKEIKLAHKVYEDLSRGRAVSQTKAYQRLSAKGFSWDIIKSVVGEHEMGRA